ncbi:MAG TPA: VTT domain-containing protein [Thermoanaerobaculia bacterium]|nr:VTT domain-containing protein [Thermoanaerobaculia bacterium]
MTIQNPAEPERPEESTDDLRGNRRRLALILILLFIGAAGFYLSPLRELVDPGLMARYLEDFAASWWAPAAFIGIYIILTLCAFPAFPMTIAATIIWGWWLGGIIELAAAILASMPPYLIGRSAAGDWVEIRMRRRVGINYDRIRARVTSAFFLLRLFPIVPYPVLNYLAGPAGIRPRPYLMATTIGSIPIVFVSTYFVDAFRAGMVSFREASIRILIAGAIFAAIYLVASFVAHRLGSKI